MHKKREEKLLKRGQNKQTNKKQGLIVITGMPLDSLTFDHVVFFCRQSRPSWQDIDVENMTSVQKKKRWLSGHVIDCSTNKTCLWILTKRCIEGIRETEASINYFKKAFNRKRICYIPDILSHPHCNLKGKYFKCINCVLRAYCRCMPAQVYGITCPYECLYE